MGNWLSAEPGLSPADTVQIPSGQRDDNRRGGEEAEVKGRNRAAVESYRSKDKKTIPAGPAAHLIQCSMQNFNFTHLLAYGIMRGGKG